MLQSSLSPFRSLSPLLWVLFPTLLLAQEESALLKYKFQPGQSLNYLVASQMVATTKVQNAEQDSTNQSSSIKELKIVAVDQQGLATIESSVKRILIKATLPGGGQLDYDSSQTDPVPLPFRMAAESIGKTTSRITLSPDGRIIKAVALQPDGTPVAIPAAGPTPRHDVLPSFPASPVQRGSTWQETFQVEVLGVDNQPRTVQLARKFQVTSISVTPNNQKLVQIGFVVEPAVPHSEPEIISRLTPFLVTGELTFDTSAGAVVAYQSELNREAVDALGPGTLLRMSGKTLEKLVPPQTPPELLKLEE
ncbi:hypothetical protein Plim_2326 [Planctopirus limnophila DSM 3776]|uniref:Uncharacterized protein n=1 Tax=Planctopirus limnophila (strain ATCC 43296 / DSM 3776 / IFAM 1008 / Mu 290) TaxID=521674 RepID=D5SNN8_PLAL2|nr:hypothetical protein [Planctopirus limnophila]ADG68152.1 hypothetical protein Plim_2326 [Planctopirus limnophila DSM 3776]